MLTTDRRTTEGRTDACLNYKFNYDPSAQVSYKTDKMFQGIQRCPKALIDNDFEKSNANFEFSSILTTSVF